MDFYNPFHPSHSPFLLLSIPPTNIECEHARMLYHALICIENQYKLRLWVVGNHFSAQIYAYITLEKEMYIEGRDVHIVGSIIILKRVVLIRKKAMEENANKSILKIWVCHCQYKSILKCFFFFSIFFSSLGCSLASQLGPCDVTKWKDGR